MGRPKRDLAKAFKSAVLEFEAATEEDSLYFGDKWKSQRR